MAITPNLNLIDFTQHSGAAGADMIAGYIKTSEPITALPVEKISSYHSVVQVMTELPTVYSRTANDGVASSKPVFEDRVFGSTLIAGHCVADKKALRMYAQQNGDGGASYKAKVVRAFIESMIKRKSFNLFYGGTLQSAVAAYDFVVDTDAMNGIIAWMTSYGINADTAFTINAGGTTAAQKSSVYALRLGEDFSKLLTVDGLGMSNDAVWREATATGSNSLSLNAEELWVEGDMGYMPASDMAMYRAYNVTADSGKECTIEVMESLAELCRRQTGEGPDIYFMNGVKRKQLYDDFKTTEILKPSMPTEFEYSGKTAPIFVTDRVIEGEVV